MQGVVDYEAVCVHYKKSMCRVSYINDKQFVSHSTFIKPFVCCKPDNIKAL